MLGIDALGYEPLQKDLYLKHLAKPQGMILVTGPTGSGKTVSLYTGLNILNKRRHQHLDRRGSGGNQPAGRQPGQRQQQGGPHLRRRAARLPAPGSGRRHGRRNPRPGDRRDRDQGRADRPPGALDAAHQRCAADADAPDRHGRQALRDRDLGEPDHRAAPGAPALHELQAAWSTCRPRRCARKASRKRTSPRPQDLRTEGLRQLHRRLQGPRRPLPGHGSHRSDRPHHHDRRQCHRHRRPGREGRRLGPAPRRASRRSRPA